MKYIVYILLFFPVWVTAQTYKYIGIEDGLSNRRIFNIQKDAQGYMWFLTNEGMDRYNGKDIKHYKLNKEGTILDAPIRLGWLYTEPHIGIWVVGKQGRVFQYEADRDDFKMVYKLPDTSEAISCGYLDRNDNIWICRKDTVLLYNIKDAHIVRFPNVLHSSITAIEQVDEHHFFIATETGVRYVKLENGILETMPVETLDYFHAQVSELYFHRQLKRLFIGSFERGVFVYDMNTQEIIRPDADLSDVNIARISPLNETELLIATEGMGVYKVNVNTCELEDYIIANGGLSFFYNWGRHKINDGYQIGKEPQKSHFNSKDKMLGVSWYQSATFFTGNRLTVGFDYQHFGGESWNKVLATGEHTPGVDKQMDEFAGYVDFRQDISSWFSLDAGIRVDHHSHVGTEWIPQGGLAFHLPKNAELKAMVSKGYRNPTIREMYMFPPANPELKPEKLINYELSYSQRLLEGALSYGISLYYINGDNLIMSNGLFPPLNINSGEIENWGVETNIGYHINSHWNVNANYSWLHMENPVLAAPEHKLYAGADYTSGRWSISTGVQYVKGLYTSVVKGSEQQDHFVLWNLRGNYRVCRFANLFIKGENLLAQRYEINAGYPMPKATFMGGINLNF